MDKAARILLYVILGIVSFQGLYSLFFSRSGFKEAIQEIKSVKSDLKMVSDSLAASRTKINSILENINENEARISLMRREVEILYLDYQKKEAVSNSERQALRTQLSKEERFLDSLKKELEKIEN